MSMDLFWDLFGGKVGEVRDGDDWDEDKDLSIFEGKYYKVGDVVGEIDSFLEGKDLSKLILFRTFAYRGEGCYSGWWVEEGKVYSLDIMNEYVVYEMEEVKE